MGFARPSLKALKDRVVADISSRTRGSAYIKKSFEYVIACTQAALSHHMHGHLDWLQLQFFPTTGNIDSLLGWGSWLKVDRKGATVASGRAVFETAVNGVTMPVGTQMQTPDGVLFEVTIAGTSSALELSVGIEAVEAGSLGNYDAGTPVTIITPIPNITSEGAIVEIEGAGTTGGTDLEDPEDLRPRILNNLRLPPAGGGPGDYVAWALEVAGVTRAWEFGNQMGYGTVSVAFMMDERADPIPNSFDVELVSAHIDAKRPLDVRAVYVQPPVPTLVNMSIALSPNTEAVRLSVTESLESLFLNDVELAAPLPESHVREAISTAAGEADHDLLSISSLTPGAWGILRLGAITFSTL